MVEQGIKVILGETDQYRNVIPEKMIAQVKEQQEYLWNKKSNESLGQRHDMVQKAYDLQPETKAEDF